MSARPQHTGRAELLRKALAQFPKGATIEQINTNGRVNASSHAISHTLTGRVAGVRSARVKDYEREYLAEDLAAFRTKSGAIEQLSTTPLHPAQSRYATNNGRYLDCTASQLEF